MPGELLQEGIYFRGGERPPPFLRLLFLNFAHSTTGDDAFVAIKQLWEMLQELKNGHVRDLKPLRPDESDIVVPSGNLKVLLGYGVRFFETNRHHERWVAREYRPSGLGPRLLGGRNRPFDSFHWSESSSSTSAQSDITFQFTAETELAVNRAIVEVKKLIDDNDLPLEFASFYGGFHRDDLRSWIDFHDGINNMREHERATAMETTGLDTPWMSGGTFLAFMRIEVDLLVWRKLSRLEQEILVGRTKLLGCPIESVVDTDGQLEITTVNGCPTSDPLRVNTSSGCPMTGLSRELPSSYRNPPRATNSLARASHIHRSNQNRGDPGQDSNNRIYRQGYEFLDSYPNGSPRVGLNFIGFQRDMATVRRILSINSWLGEVNFGGPAGEGQEPPPVRLMSLQAGGFYCVPPKENPFPGSSVFTFQV